MSKVYSITTTEKPLEPSSVAWMKWGMMSNGNCITANIIGHLRGQRTRQVFPLGRIDKKIDKSIKQSRIKYNLKSDRQAERVYDGDGLAPTLGHGNATSQPFIAVVNDRKGLRKVKRATCLDANYFKGHDYHGARTLIYKLVKAVLTPDRATGSTWCDD